MDVLSIVFLIAGGGWGLFVLFFGFTAVLNRPLSRVMQRRAERRARQAELRRRKKLDPITDMVEWKARRRVEEQQEWMLKLRALMPAPDPYDSAAVRAERELFSGDVERAQKALEPQLGGVVPVVVRPARDRYQLMHSSNGTTFAVLDGAVLWDKKGNPWDGKHHRTCPYECDCPDQIRSTV